LKNFIKHAFVLFLALRAGDLVSITAGMWFVPRYVSPEDIGAVLPITSFATFLSLPIFALAMTVMKESACLSSNGERGKIKSLLKGTFLTTTAILGFTLAATALSMPIFLNKMRIDDSLAGFLVVASAFLGCCAPVWTDALQSLKRFNALADEDFAIDQARVTKEK
jgi:O-antigen/teichoic acid export membrane protein